MASLGSLVMSVEAKSGKFKSALRAAENSASKFTTGMTRAEMRANKLKRAVGKIGRQSKKTEGIVTRNFTKMGDSIRNKATGAILAFTAAIGAAGFATLRLGRGFSASIAELSAITGATGEDLEFLSDAAKEFGATTTLTASQAAKAFTLIASAKPDLLKILPDLKAVTKETLALAEASGTDLPTAADTLANAMNQFGVGADQAGRFINVLAAGAKFGSSLVPQTSEALRNSGTTAELVGISFEEMNAAIQGLAKAGVKGSDAGTKLRNVLVRLEAQSKDKLKPTVVGLATALDNLAKESLTVTEATDLFGLRSFEAGLTLIKFKENVKELIEQLTGSTIAYEQADIKAGSYDGKLKSLSSAIEGVGLSIFDSMKPGLTASIESLTDLFRSIGPVVGSIASFAIVVGKSGLLAIGLLALVPLISKTTTAIVGLGAASSVAATNMTKLQVAAGLVFTAFTGFQIGKILGEKFHTARVAGINFTTSVKKGVLILQEGFIRMMAIIKGKWDETMESMRDKTGVFLSVASGVLDKVGLEDWAIQLQGVGEGMMGVGDAAAIMAQLVADSNQRVTDGLNQINTIRTDMIADSLIPVVDNLDEVADKAEEAAVAIKNLGTFTDSAGNVKTITTGTEFKNKIQSFGSGGSTASNQKIKQLEQGILESRLFRATQTLRSTGRGRKALQEGRDLGRIPESGTTAEVNVQVVLDTEAILAEVRKDVRLKRNLIKAAKRESELLAENTARRVGR